MATAEFDRSNYIVTPKAVAMLNALTREYGKELKFHVFAQDDGEYDLRVHDKDYAGDWLITTSGVGVSMCDKTRSENQLLLITCGRSAGTSGFKFFLYVDSDHLVALEGDEVICRITTN